MILFTILPVSKTVFTFHVNDEGVGSLLPELSTVMISTICLPLPRLSYCTGLVQVENDEPSIEHSKWLIPTSSPSSTLVSLPEKVKVMLVDTVSEPSVKLRLLPSIAVFIIVSGGTVSTVHVNDAGDGSLLPELSNDLASSIWAPSARLLN